MNVVYKKSLWNRILDATIEATRLNKQIDHIELAPSEVVECYQELCRTMYDREKLPQSLQEFAETNNGKCYMYGARLTWL